MDGHSSWALRIAGGILLSSSSLFAIIITQKPENLISYTLRCTLGHRHYFHLVPPFEYLSSLCVLHLASIIRISRHGICYCEHSNRERPNSRNCIRPTPGGSNRQYSRCELSNHEFFFPILRLAPGNTPQYFDVHGPGRARKRDLVGSRRQVHT